MATAGRTGNFRPLQKMPMLIKDSSGKSRIKSKSSPELTLETSKPKG
jgi:hypothetical protein